MKRNRNREDPGEQETSDDEGIIEEKVMREVKQHFRNKDCIVVFRDHVIRKRAGSRNAEVWIRDNELEVIWDDFKSEATAAVKKKLAIKMLKEETER